MANQINKKGINTGISWCDATVNLWWGCTKKHTGCKNCYAEAQSKRFGENVWGDDAPRKLIKSAFRDLAKYQRQAQKANKKLKIFIGSMMDIFEDSKPLINPDLPNIKTTFDLKNKLIRKIYSNEYPNLVFLFLTKRPENIINHLPIPWVFAPINLWLGVSISDDETHWKMRQDILDSRWVGHVFYSIEPQVADISSLDLRHVDWVIQGCESGPNRRPFDLAWAYKMKRICKEQNVPYFLKQIQDDHGQVIKKLNQFPKDLQIQEFPKLFGSHKLKLYMQGKLVGEATADISVNFSENNEQ